MNHKRVARLMRLDGVVGVARRKTWRTTKRDPGARAAPDLVKRDFSAQRPDESCMADITNVRTASDFLYLAVVVDAGSRRVVGWCTRRSLQADLIVRALDRAVAQGRPEPGHPSLRPGQYTPIAFWLRCEHANAPPSMGSVDDAYDNACESFLATLGCEPIERERLRNQAEARMAIFDFIEAWYNPHRRPSALGQKSPSNFEKLHLNAA